MARYTDYGIATLENDAFFKLLPHVVQASDPGAVRLWMRAAVEQHNRYMEAARALPRLQNPHLAAKFSPADFGESQQIYDDYISMLHRWGSLTSGEREYANVLARSIPKSLVARKLEEDVLRELATNVGEIAPSGRVVVNMREFISSAIARHHIKGSHSSVRMLGLVIGFTELKVVELWSRFAIKDPSDPAALRNHDDFSYYPELYPYWPLSEQYGTPDNLQYPEPDAAYNPLILDDGPSDYEIEFPTCVIDRLSPFWYNRAVNSRNPFGSFTDEVVSKLKIGSYSLQGGTQYTRAAVSIPGFSSGRYTFEAITFGEYGNKIRLTVSGNSDGSQSISISGPQSKIKFKSSFFDLTIAANASLFPYLYPAVPVTENADASQNDDATGREPGGFPTTGTADGTRIISDPDTHYQIDRDALEGVFGQIRSMFERVRPITRTPRNTLYGFFFKDQMPYAPILVTNIVNLRSSNGTIWTLTASNTGVPSFTAWDGTGDAPTITEIIQSDFITRQLYRWSVSDDGTWIGQATLTGDESVVYLRLPEFQGYVVIEGNVLRTSTVSPERIVDTIHSDGTENESVLSEQYGLVVENPATEIQQYMSVDAVSDDVPDDRLVIQTSPEDSVTITVLLTDYYRFHADAHFGVEEQGFGAGNWWYSFTGQVYSEDVRLRSAGITAGIIEPVPGGTEDLSNGLRYDYPVQFLDYHGVYTWRDRISNEAKMCEYTYDSPAYDVGASYTEISMAEFDGPIEGTNVVAPGYADIPDVGDGVTPNGQYPADIEINQLIVQEANGRSNPCNAAHASDQDGSVLLTFSQPHLMARGMKLYAISGSYEGWHEVLQLVTPTTLILRTAYVSDEYVQLAIQCLESMTVAPQTVTVQATRQANGSQLNVLVFENRVLLDVLNLTNEFESELELSIGGGSNIQIACQSNLGASIKVLMPDNDLSSLEGSLMMSGGQRVVVEATLLEDGEYFWRHGEGKISPLEPVGGLHHWRGGTWRGSGIYLRDSTGRDGIPPILTLVDGPYVLGDDDSVVTGDDGFFEEGEDGSGAAVLNDSGGQVGDDQGGYEIAD